MSKPSLRWLISPPVRLRAIPDGWVPLFRVLWFLSFLLAIATVALGTAYALRETYEVRPVFRSLALDYDVEDDGWVSIKTEARPEAKYRLLAIDGSPVSPNIRTGELARRLGAAGSGVVTLDLAGEDGSRTVLHQARDRTPLDPAKSRTRDLRVATRLMSGLAACGVLLLCSFLLARRRPNDPVAMLFAFAFAGLAATIDPPLALWMAYGWPLIYDVVSSGWFYLMLLALATFPDGIFVPRGYRWLIPLGIPLAVFVSLHGVNSDVQALVGLGSLLAVVAAQFFRYRRLASGVERQQIKWAAFGFAAGLILVSIAFALLPFLPTGANQTNVVLNVAVVLLFSLGMAVLPLGLLIALTWYRLWEADTVITRSAAYAVVTLIVGVVWAASSDLVKLVIEELIGRQSEAGAATVGAVVAAGIFSPTQSLVLGWTRKRFGGPVDKMHSAAARLKAWGLTEPPAEVATRALAIIDDALHPCASAITVNTALSQELIAARNAASADDPHLTERFTIADDESPVGELLIGRRSDRNRYNREQLEALEALLPALAEALRVARSHHSRESMMQQRLDEMAARLAELEGGKAKPA